MPIPPLTLELAEALLKRPQEPATAQQFDAFLQQETERLVRERAAFSLVRLVADYDELRAYEPSSAQNRIRPIFTVSAPAMYMTGPPTYLAGNPCTLRTDRVVKLTSVRYQADRDYTAREQLAQCLQGLPGAFLTTAQQQNREGPVYLTRPLGAVRAVAFQLHIWAYALCGWKDAVVIAPFGASPAAGLEFAPAET